ncbi:MAG: hypothetical protein WBC44_22115 [Planctomycetaceae bacterium]
MPIVISAPAPPGLRMRAAGAMAATAVLLFGCTDSIAPAPTGQIEGGADTPRGFANEVPRTNAGRPVVGDAGGVGRSEPGETPRNTGRETAPADVAATAKSGLSDRFYEIAAEAGAGGPVGRPVEVDDRASAALNAPAANHPPLTAFEPADEPLPAHDSETTYASIVDPAEGEPTTSRKPIGLTSGGDAVESVRFSSLAAAQVVVASRVNGGTDRTRLDKYDLTSGKLIGTVELPDRAELLDVAPDGSRVLVRLTFGLAPQSRPASSQTRLDVWEMTEDDVRHIVGWQPGAKKSDTPAVPIDAAFVDGDRVVTVTDDGALTLWNLADAKAAYTVDASADGPLLMTPGRKYVAVFDGTTFAAFEAGTGAFRGRLTPPRPTLAACPDAAFSPDGAQLVAVLQRPAQSLLSWDVAAGRPISEIEAPLDLERGLHFGSPGYVVAGGVLFDVDRKKPVWLYTRNANCRNVGCSPDRRHWIVMQPAFKDPVLEAIEAPTDKVASAAIEASNLTSPRLGPGDALAVRLDLTNFDGDRSVLDAAFAKELGRVLAGHGLRLDRDAKHSLVVEATEKPTGERISFDNIGDGGDEIVPTHDIEFTASLLDSTGKPLWTETGRVPPTYFLAKQKDKTLEQVLLEKLWESAPGAISATLENSMPVYLRSTPPAAALGQTRLWAGANDVSLPSELPVATTDGSPMPDDGDSGLDSVTSLQPTMTLTAGTSGIRDLLVTRPPLNLIVTTGDDGVARIFQPVSQSRTLKKVDDLRTEGGATKLALYPGGDRFAYGSEGGEVRVYDLVRKNVAMTLSGADGALTAVSVTWEPMLVGGTQGGRVYRWTENDRSNPEVLAEGQAQITGIAAVPYQNRVIATWADGSAKMIDVGTGEIVETYDLDAGRIYGVAVSPDVATIAFATESSGAVLVDLDSSEETGRLDEAPVTAVTYRPDGVHLATADRQGRIMLWNTSDQSPDRRLEGAGGKVSSIVFSPDGNGVAAAVAGRRTIPVWELKGMEDTPGEMSGEPTESFGRTPRNPLSVQSRPSGRSHAGPRRSHSE